jgi:DNA primase
MPFFKLLSLNVRNGGGTRVAAICQFLGSHKPDVIVLTEWQEGTSGRNFMDWIKSQGLLHKWWPYSERNMPRSAHPIPN